MIQFLRFTNADAWSAAAAGAGFMFDDSLLAYTHEHAIDVIGTIAQGGEYGSEMGEVIVAPEVLPGWHVNYIGTLPANWETALVTPVLPYRVFA
jgi:hypothetical protein